ncbi:MAG: hypothetical protein ACI956_001745 [Nonlabens sp.]|jgi:hypothetical protein
MRNTHVEAAEPPRENTLALRSLRSLRSLRPQREEQ